MLSEQDKTGRIARNTVVLFFRMMLVMGVGLVTSRVVLDKLGVEDFGIYSLVGGVVVLFSFLQQALNNATYRYLTFSIGEGDPDKQRNVFSMSLNAHLILACVIILLSETIGLWILNFKLVIPEARQTAANVAYQMSVICTCLNVIRTPYNSIIVAHEKMDFFAWTSIAEAVLQLLVVYILVIGNLDKLILYSVLCVALSAFMLLWYRFHCSRHFGECRYRRVWDGKLIADMVKYSGLSIIVNGVDVCVSQSAVFFFNAFFGLVANAALGIANKVNGMMNAFLSSYTTAYNPQIVKSYASGERDYFIKLIFSSSRISYFLLLLVSIPVVLNVDFILDIWLKNPPEGSGLFFQLIIIHSLIDAYSAPLWIGVHATGNLKTHQILMASIKILNIPLAYVMLKAGCPAWSVLAVKAVLNFICSIVRPCYVKRLYGLPLRRYFREVWIPVYIVTALSVPLPFFVASGMADGWMRLLISSAVFFALALPSVFVVLRRSGHKNFLNFL